MNTCALALFVCFVLLVAGCKTGGVTGRLHEVLVSEIKRWGGNPAVSETPATVPARWIIKRDRFGTVLYTADLTFKQVNEYLTRAYGPPRKGGITAEGHQQWVIPATIAGVSIWYAESDGGIRITVLKPLRIGE